MEIDLNHSPILNLFFQFSFQKNYIKNIIITTNIVLKKYRKKLFKISVHKEGEGKNENDIVMSVSITQIMV